MPSRNGLTLRPFAADDLDAVMRLFRETVHAINATDYTPQQLEAWAPARPDGAAWLERMKNSVSFVVEKGGAVVGFGNMTHEGKLDTLYVGAKVQKQGVGGAILARLIAEARRLQRKTIHTEASITARPFFEKHGFTTEREMRKERNGLSFRTFYMTKEVVNGDADDDDTG